MSWTERAAPAPVRRDGRITVVGVASALGGDAPFDRARLDALAAG